MYKYRYVCKCVYVRINKNKYRKERCQVPIFPHFWKCSVFCSILLDHLCSYTCYGITRDPHRLSDFLRGCQRMSRESWKSPGKRMTNKHSVYIYIYTYGFLWRRGGQGKNSFFFFGLIPSQIPPMYIASPWRQVAKGCQRMSREPGRSSGKRKEVKQT